jgi:hypothetical protein
MHPTLTALSRFDAFAASMSAWTGEPGYGERYTPTMLTALDYIERLCGIYPTADGALWFTSVLPKGMDAGENLAKTTRYARTVNGAELTLENTESGARVFRHGELLGEFPAGVRVVTEDGSLTSVVGMTVREVAGTVTWGGEAYPFSVRGNEVLRLRAGRFESVRNPGIVYPTY